jgi:hypothetical protein
MTGIGYFYSSTSSPLLCNPKVAPHSLSTWRALRCKFLIIACLLPNTLLSSRPTSCHTALFSFAVLNTCARPPNDVDARIANTLSPLRAPQKSHSQSWPVAIPLIVQLFASIRTPIRTPTCSLSPSLCGLPPPSAPLFFSSQHEPVGSARIPEPTPQIAASRAHLETHLKDGSTSSHNFAVTSVAAVQLPLISIDSPDPQGATPVDSPKPPLISQQPAVSKSTTSVGNKPFIT